MRRRAFLAAGGAALGAATAGCQSLLETGSTRSPPLVDDRPEAVYVPTHVEGMEMVGMATSERYRFGLSYSFPHRFWLVTGDRVRQVEIGDGDTIHLMLTAWDAETGTVIPTSNAVVTASRGGEVVVSETSLWPMLSQNMGVHFGDNVGLDGDGTYGVDLDFGPVETRLAGALAGTLGEQASATVQMEFSQQDVEDISFEEFGSRAGQEGAVDPMGMGENPTGQAPPAENLPGELLGEATSGDAAFVATALSRVPEGVEGEGTYLAVSARTPYNRYPLPFMSLSATLSRDGETAFEGDLTGTLHPEIGHHYGAVVDGVRAGDTLRIAVDAPPQVARHEGYETAFVEMDTVEVTA
jgi:hypothetical protein